MAPRRRFPPKVLAAIDVSKILGIRAGATHRIIGIWVVVAEGRVFVRSWTLKPGGWYHTFRNDPHGVITIGTRTIRVRAIQTRSERLKRAVDDAYAAKYPTPASRKYVQGFARGKRRDSTTELVPE